MAALTEATVGVCELSDALGRHDTSRAHLPGGRDATPADALAALAPRLQHAASLLMERLSEENAQLRVEAAVARAGEPAARVGVGRRRTSLAAARAESCGTERAEGQGAKVQQCSMPPSKRQRPEPGSARRQGRDDAPPTAVGAPPSAVHEAMRLGCVRTTHPPEVVCHEVAKRLQLLLRHSERANALDGWSHLAASSVPALHALLLAERPRQKLVWVGAGTAFEIACLALLARTPFEVTACDVDAGAIRVGHQLLDTLGASGFMARGCGVRYLNDCKIVLQVQDGLTLRSARAHDTVYSIVPVDDALCSHLYDLAWHAGARLALLTRAWRHAGLPGAVSGAESRVLALGGSKTMVEVSVGYLGPKLVPAGEQLPRGLA